MREFSGNAAKDGETNEATHRKHFDLSSPLTAFLNYDHNKSWQKEIQMNELLKYSEGDLEASQFHPDARFEDCEFQSFDFTAYNLKGVIFQGCRFNSCNFANVNLTNASIQDCSFHSCNLLGVNWCVLRKFEWSQFYDSRLNLSSFQDLKLKKNKFVKCSIVDADFSGGDLTDSDFSESNLAGTNFEGAVLNGVDFRGARDYLLDLRKAKIKGAKFSLPHVLALITVLGAEVEY